eukprot:4385664-Pleurochrysis_carterae.AAC.4
MDGVTVRMETIFACKVACDCCPRVRRVARTLSSAVIVVALVDSWLPCVTTAGDAATTAFAAGTTSTPTCSSDGTNCPSGRRRVDVPVFASTFSPTCASVASRPRLMRLCDALLSTSTFLSLIATVSPPCLCV